jgi:hypothetical protein
LGQSQCDIVGAGMQRASLMYGHAPTSTGAAVAGGGGGAGGGPRSVTLQERVLGEIADGPHRGDNSAAPNGIGIGVGAAGGSHGGSNGNGGGPGGGPGPGYRHTTMTEGELGMYTQQHPTSDGAVAWQL